MTTAASSKPAKPAPIKDRIAKAFTPGCRYYDLEAAVFPVEQFPRAWTYATKGGPPACRRVMVAALQRHGYRISGDYLANRTVERARAK